jgi:selenocysteine-specific elongation factor
VALLDAGDALAPGAQARLQLVLQKPIAAWRGDRVVLRDTSASRTLAGGCVLDPWAPARYRRTAQRLALLDAAALDTSPVRLQAALAATPQGLDVARWVRAEGLRAGALPAMPAGALCSRAEGAMGWALAAAGAQAAREAALGALARYHAAQPDELGPDAARLRRLALAKLPDALWRELLADLLRSGRVAQRGAFVHLPEHGVRLSAGEQRMAQKVAVPLQRAGFEGAWVRDLARDAQESEALMRTTLSRLAQRGELHQVVKDLFYPPGTIHRLAAIARQLGATSDVTAARFRDATQLGRKRAIQVLEYFDRVGLLRRTGDVHRVRSDTDLFREPA